MEKKEKEEEREDGGGEGGYWRRKDISHLLPRGRWIPGLIPHLPILSLEKAPQKQPPSPRPPFTETRSLD